MLTCIKLIAYYFAYQLVFAFIIPPCFKLAGVDESMLQTYSTGLTMVMAGIMMILHLVLFNYIIITKESLQKLPAKTVLRCIPLILTAMVFFNLVSEVIDLPNLMEDVFINLCKTPLGFISVALMAPIVEEILFRGTIEERFLQLGYSPKKAIIISALIFGIIHLNPAQIPFAFCIGAIFGWLYYKTQSIVPGIIGHFINNFCAATLMATLSPEELKTSTAEWLGIIPTYLIIIGCFIGMFASLYYLNIYFSETKCK